MAVKPVPEGYRTVTPYLLVRDAAKLIDFLTQGFGGIERHRTTLPNGVVMHAEVQIGDSRVMLGQVPLGHAPMAAGIYLYVPDADAVYAGAINAGAVAITPPSDQFYGDRVGGVNDPAGNTWWIATHQEDVPADEIARRAAGAARERAGANA